MALPVTTAHKAEWEDVKLITKWKGFVRDWPSFTPSIFLEEDSEKLSQNSS
jgi:hypothetical protein